MKTLKHLLFSGLALMLVLYSCTMEKRIYSSGYHIEWNKSKQNPDRQKLASKTAKQNQTVTVEQSEIATNTVDNSPPVIDDNITASVDNSIIMTNTTPSPQKYFLIINSVEECDSIILKNGEEIKAKVTEIASDEIKYKKCDNLNGPTYTIKKSEVFMIKYSNGTEDIITPNNSNSIEIINKKNNGDEPEINGMALAGFICGIVGLLLALIMGWSFLLGILGVIFSAIGLGQIRKNPTKWKGKGFAIAGLIAGILAIVIFWIYIAIIWYWFLLW